MATSSFQRHYFVSWFVFVMKEYDSARYGRFDDFALIDSASRTVQFQYDTTSNKVAIIIPHFWEAAGMTLIIKLATNIFAEFDPNFQVLVDPNYDQSNSEGSNEFGQCGDGVKHSSSKNVSILNNY